LTMRENYRHGYFAFAVYALFSLVAFWFPLTVALVTTMSWAFWWIYGIGVKGEQRSRAVDPRGPSWLALAFVLVPAVRRSSCSSAAWSSATTKPSIPMRSTGSSRPATGSPRSIPSDWPFLEKPPLKFWMVAGLMKLGLIPHDDWGMRFPDAVLCTLAFLYIYRLGARLSGPVAGAVSVSCCSRSRR
jgi:hypothetical protein